MPLTYEAVFYYGVAHGIFAANGIDLSIYPGSGSAVSVAATSAGKFDFGFTDVGTLAQLISIRNVSNVKAVGMIIHYNPLIILYNKAHINSLNDLNGKTMSCYQGSGVCDNLFKVFAPRNGINISTLKTTMASAATFAQLVATGKVDFTATLASQFVIVTPVAVENNIQLGQFVFSDYGFKVLGFALIARTDTINNNPTMVRHFMNASMWSLLGTMQHIQEAVQDMAKSNPSLNVPSAVAGFKAIIKIAVPPNVNSTSNALTLGWIDPNEMQNTVEVINQAYHISNPPPATTMYDNQFVKAP